MKLFHHYKGIAPSSSLFVVITVYFLKYRYVKHDLVECLNSSSFIVDFLGILYIGSYT
jgi:hypothetical protein